MERNQTATRNPGSLDALVGREIELCKQDVCMYCGGRALGYKRTPDGPNEAGNWTHQYTTTMRTGDRVLCQASAIFARENYERRNSPNARLTDGENLNHETRQD